MRTNESKGENNQEENRRGKKWKSREQIQEKDANQEKDKIKKNENQERKMKTGRNWGQIKFRINENQEENRRDKKIRRTNPGEKWKLGKE